MQHQRIDRLGRCRSCATQAWVLAGFSVARRRDLNGCPCLHINAGPSKRSVQRLDAYRTTALDM